MTITQLTAFVIWLFLTFPGSWVTRMVLGLPATMVHELAHWFIALITGSRPGFPSLWPRKEGSGWVLGSVEFVVYPRVAGLVALAPLWCLGPWAWWLLMTPPHPADSALHQIVVGVLAGYLAVGAVPSSQDWYIALKYPLGSLAVIVVLTIAVRFALGLEA